MKKRILSLLVVLALAITFVPTIAMAEASEFAGGSGTEADPYLISNKHHLNNVRNYLDAHYKLTCDIEFLPEDFTEGGYFYNGGTGFSSIGWYRWNSGNPFVGSFDGNGFSIKNLYINKSSKEGDVSAGLFGYNKGVIKNLGIVDCNITASSKSEYVAVYVGAIVAYNEGGTIENCYNTGLITSDSVLSSYIYVGGIVGFDQDYKVSSIIDCYNTGYMSLTAGQIYAGGIVGAGSNLGAISNCYNSGSMSLTAGSVYAGGIAGGSEGNTTNVFNTGAIAVNVKKAYVGGISGFNRGSIINAYNTGDFSVVAEQSNYTGGIAGKNWWYSGYEGEDKKGYGEITNSYYIDNVLVGIGDSNGFDAGVKCTADQIKLSSTFVGFDFKNTWIMSGEYPVLRVFHSQNDGWVYENGWVYYENGVTVKNTWKKDSKGWCYLGADGKMATNKWVRDSVGWCYVGADGYAVTNCWKKDSVGWCYLNSEGSMTKNKWVLDGGKWYFIDSNGYMVSNTWRQDSSGWCYLGSDGAMQTNKWIMDSQGWCYVGSNGYCLTNCWMADSVGWCYLDADGRMVVNDWVQDSTGWCWLNANGYWDGIYH